MEAVYTVREVADMLKMSRKTVLRRFGDYPGVLDVGALETVRKAGKRSLRIPESVLNRFMAERKAA